MTDRQIPEDTGARGMEQRFAVLDEGAKPRIYKSLTINTPPPTNIKRWTFRRKAQVVLAVCCGLITREHACERYCISREEFLSWERSIKKHGARGL